jgi:hypothetical protein
VTYQGQPYSPPWLDGLADDVTIEGSAMDGVAHGPDAVRTILLGIRSLYDEQDFHYVGPYRETGWIEDYSARVDGDTVSCVVLVDRDADGQTHHIVANYRPRSSLVHLARLLGDKFAGTPVAGHFITA